MAEQRLLHYRHGGKISHIGVEALPEGKDITVTIESISFVEDGTINGQKQDFWEAKFVKNPYFILPMVLNSTNKKRLAKLANTPYLETVKNLPIILTQEMSKMVDGGKDMALRISNIKPKQIEVEKPIVKQPLTLTSAKYAEVKIWLEGTGTIANLLKVYDPDSECLMELKKIKEV